MNSQVHLLNLVSSVCIVYNTFDAQESATIDEIHWPYFPNWIWVQDQQRSVAQLHTLVTFITQQKKIKKKIKKIKKNK